MFSFMLFHALSMHSFIYSLFHSVSWLVSCRDTLDIGTLGLFPIGSLWKRDMWGGTYSKPLILRGVKLYPGDSVKTQPPNFPNSLLERPGLSTVREDHAKHKVVIFVGLIHSSEPKCENRLLPPSVCGQLGHQVGTDQCETT